MNIFTPAARDAASGFLLWYGIEWLWRYAKCRNFMKAYHDLYFEREAYLMQGD